VLIVEGNPLVREQAERMLRDAGFRCLSAADGPSALALLDGAARQIDILFSDVMMPGGLSGRALADEVRRRHPGLPVLLTSGYDVGEPPESGQLDAYEMLAKPYSRDALVAALLRELARDTR
jgi:CheY-like chemotaxis protein